MIALKVTTSTMASTSISTPLHQPHHIWVRRLSSPSSSSPSAITSSRRIFPLLMSKKNNTSSSSTVINRKSGGGGGERISVWWRDGLRLISCADFGWDKNIGGGHKKSFSTSSSSSSNQQLQSSSINNNTNHHKMKDEEREREKDGDDKVAPKLLTIPTILTLGRVAAIPLLITTFYSNSWWATTATTSIFIAAAITDWLDGYIARKMHLGTPFGAFLDPVADKLMVAATLVLLCTRPLEVGAFGEIPWLLPIPSIAIIGREITMSAVREWAASQNGKVLEAVAVNNLGKWKTASQMVALTILLATRDTSIVGSNILVPTGVSLLYISAGLAVWSLAVYMKKIWRVLLKL